MTNPAYGPSLFQARRTDLVHQHSHLHNRKSSLAHARSHADFHNRRDETADLDPRGATITEVVQTIAVVQIIDGAGATLSVQTLPGTSQTDLIDAETGATLAVNHRDIVPTTGDVDATTASVVSAISSADPVTATETSILSADSSTTETTTPDALSLTRISTSTSLPSSFSTLSSSNSTTSSLTSSSLTSSTSISSLVLPSASTNSSSTSSTDSASSTGSFLSSFSSSAFSQTTFASSTISSTLSTPTSSTLYGESSTTGWLSPTDTASATSGAGGDGSGATATDAGTSSTSASESSGTTQTTKVAGGIVGGIAGLALLVALAFMVVRMKKRGWCHLRLGGGVDEPDAAARQALPAPAPAPSGAGAGGGTEATSAYGTMQQRTAPLTVAGSLAALAGKRLSRERAGSGGEMAERGFVRVSGKKLPPVLQFGGDGYSDPRDNRASHLSEASASGYRDSIAVFDQPQLRPLALGSPMRPESGIMTMHPGPARTPVTSEVPSMIEPPSLPRSSTFPATDALGRTLENTEGFSRDAVGRTLAVQDQSRDGAASRGSHQSRGSTRFTEHVG